MWRDRQYHLLWTRDHEVCVGVVLTFGCLQGGGHGAGGGGREQGVDTHRGTQVLEDLGVGAGLAPGALPQQLGDEGGGVALDQRVLLALGRLHQGPYQRVELVGQRPEVDQGAGGKHVHPQVQLLPLGAGLAHRGLGLLPLAVKGLPLLGVQVEARG